MALEVTLGNVEYHNAEQTEKVMTSVKDLPLMTEFSGVLTVENEFMKLFGLLIVITGSDDLFRAERLFGPILLMVMGCRLPSLLGTDHSSYERDTLGKIMQWYYTWFV